MILELDCGNSFIKWRVIHLSDSVIFAGGTVNSDESLIETLRQLGGLSFVAGRAVSVRSVEESDNLARRLKAGFGVEITFARSMPELHGVVNGYTSYEKLGLDRWLALVAAYKLAGKACLVLDLGTAITSDFVDASGHHLGGFICPGMPLMRNQLRTHTRRIRYDDSEAREALSSFAPGRSTAEAVERGCALMARGFAQSQLSIARDHWGVNFDVFVTGGDAPLVEGVLPAALVVPDLIFIGLALACPVE